MTHMLTQQLAELDLSPFRASQKDVARQHAVLEAHGFPRALNTVSGSVAVVNDCHQLVFCNNAFLDAAGIAALDEVQGLRLGEAFPCTHTREGKHGCGSSEYCSQCGALRATQFGFEGCHAVQDCVISRDNDETIIWDLRICAAPLLIEECRFVVLSLQDTTHEKRRRSLEHIFFHDILNTVGGMKSVLDCLCDDVPQELKNDAELLQDLTSRLIDEIVSQKQLLAAESNDLTLNITPLRTRDVLRAACEAFGASIHAREKEIVVDHDMSDTIIYSDFALLRRVLGNMLKNALEASPRGGQVAMGCRVEQTEIVFWVKNTGYIPKVVQLKIFNRTFSTKGEGRGFGTYGIRLLTERYLGGRVDFDSGEASGTIFRVRLPFSPDTEPEYSDVAVEIGL